MRDAVTKEDKLGSQGWHLDVLRDGRGGLLIKLVMLIKIVMFELCVCMKNECCFPYCSYCVHNCHTPKQNNVFVRLYTRYSCLVHVVVVSYRATRVFWHEFMLH